MAGMESQRWFDRARAVMPGGVNSPVRAFRAVGGAPPVIRQAEGCRLVDVDGCAYVDYVGSWGAMIAGHAHPDVVRRVSESVSRGSSFGTSSTAEILLAEEIRRRVSCIEKIRMVNSGTEAVMSAVRLARAATGRSMLVKFDGGYHGHADGVLVRAGSGPAALGLADSPGVTPAAARDTLSIPYNDPNAVESAFAAFPDAIAAVIVEPVAGNMGVVPPEPAFLQSLRETTARHGAFLIFDEVMTGFRVARGGAVERYAVTPDLVTFGKIIGGGLPVGAFAGPAVWMDRMAPVGPVYQAGTLSGNPVAMTAGLATIELLDESAYARLESVSARLEQGIRDAVENAGVPATVQRVASMLTLFFTNRPVRNFDDARRADHSRFARFFHAMLEGGVHLPPSGYEAWFVSLAHTDEVIDFTIDCVRRAMKSSAGQPV
jgi:glutamate-1-semialdehyde 2,1-aminomutase